MEGQTIEQDTGYAPRRWAFDGEVTRVFDDMLQRSIPQYLVMRNLCYEVGRAFVQPQTDIVDLGCSRGQSSSAFVMHYPENHFVLVETAPSMLDTVRALYRDAANVTIYDLDLRRDYPSGVRASLTLAILTIQFIPIEYRQQVLRHTYEATLPGGALLFVEKILGSTALLDQQLVNVYLDMKRRNMYSEDEIQRKRLALEGVLVPVTAKWNEDMLHAAGFSQIECFWRWSNFAGWVAVKE